MVSNTTIINGLGYLILVALLVLSCGLGAYAAYLAMFAALAGLVVAFDRYTLLQLLRHTWLQMWLLAFALIAIAFSVSAQSANDVLYALDFAEIPLALAAGLVFSKMTAGKGIKTVALLSFIGTVVALGVALYGTNILHMSRPSGLEMSTIHFAYFSVILGFLSLAGFFVEGEAEHKIYLLGPPFGLIAAALTGTRGIILVLAASLLVLLIFFVRFANLTPTQKWQSIACVPVLGIGVGVLGFVFGFSRAFMTLAGVAQAFAGYQDADVSASLRVDHLTAGASAFMDAPWFGHGWVHQVSAALPYMDAFAQEVFLTQKWAYLHNELLSLAVSAGALGILAYLLIFAAPVVSLVRSVRDTQYIARAYGLFIVICGFFVGGMTEVLFKYEIPKAFLFFMVPVLLLCCRDAPVRHQTARSS